MYSIQTSATPRSSRRRSNKGRRRASAGRPPAAAPPADTSDVSDDEDDHDVETNLTAAVLNGDQERRKLIGGGGGRRRKTTPSVQQQQPLHHQASVLKDSGYSDGVTVSPDEHAQGRATGRTENDFLLYRIHNLLKCQGLERYAKAMPVSRMRPRRICESSRAISTTLTTRRARPVSVGGKRPRQAQQAGPDVKSSYRLTFCQRSK